MARVHSCRSTRHTGAVVAPTRVRRRDSGDGARGTGGAKCAQSGVTRWTRSRWLVPSSVSLSTSSVGAAARIADVTE